MNKIILIFTFLLINISAFSQDEEYTKSDRKQIKSELNEVLTDIEENYAYFDKKNIDIQCLKEEYGAKIKLIKNENDKILFFEYLLDELYDSHVHLDVAVKKSYRLYSPIYAITDNGKTTIQNVWQNQITNLDKNIIGAEILKFNGQIFNILIDSFPTICSDKKNEITRNWISNKILAGRYSESRNLELLLKNGEHYQLNLDDLTLRKNKSLLTTNKVENIGVITINNSLGESALILEFDNALNSLMQTDGLIIDLRNTVDGGDSYIARGIMSRFIEKDSPYQKHSYEEYDEGFPKVKRSWIELVSPRGDIYKKPVVILVGKWTGSMGEGLAIGFEGMERAEIVGTEMERLAGSIEDFTIGDSDFGYSLSTEQLFHINGTPREEYIPANYVKQTEIFEDEILKKGIEIINKSR
jgi:carboxyl-terminal processing protease